MRHKDENPHFKNDKHRFITKDPKKGWLISCPVQRRQYRLKGWFPNCPLCGIGLRKIIRIRHDGGGYNEQTTLKKYTKEETGNMA